MSLGDLEEVTTAAELRAILGEVSTRAATKERDRLHEIDRLWLGASPFCLVATSAADGSCDVSPKGDPPGFTHIIDAKTIALPERPGNRRADGFHNILQNPHVGLIYLIPGRADTLRINGRGRVLREAPFFESMRVKGHRPLLALLVEIEQVFFHCSKALLRSDLWEGCRVASEAVPSRAAIAKALEDTSLSLEELEVYYGESYRAGLYR